MDIELLPEKLRAFSYSRLALAEIGDLTVQEAVRLIDANADGMFETLEAQGLWGAIQRLEETRADLREGIRALFGDLPSDVALNRPVVVEAAATIKCRIANIASIQHRQTRKALQDALAH